MIVLNSCFHSLGHESTIRLCTVEDDVVLLIRLERGVRPLLKGAGREGAVSDLEYFYGDGLLPGERERLITIILVEAYITRFQTPPIPPVHPPNKSSTRHSLFHVLSAVSGWILRRIQSSRSPRTVSFSHHDIVTFRFSQDQRIRPSEQDSYHIRRLSR